MIKDILDNAETYYGISENLKTGFEWLKNNDLESIKNGRYVINDNVYANVQDYTTKDDALYEAHKEYIDIQYMVKGKELIGISDIKNCKIREPYDSDKDIAFFGFFIYFFSIIFNFTFISSMYTISITT